MLGQTKLSHIRKVTAAEAVMLNFIVMHNLSFECADHLYNLYGVMFISHLNI